VQHEQLQLGHARRAVSGYDNEDIGLGQKFSQRGIRAAGEHDQGHVLALRGGDRRGGIGVAVVDQQEHVAREAERAQLLRAFAGQCPRKRHRRQWWAFALEAAGQPLRNMGGERATADHQLAAAGERAQQRFGGCGKGSGQGFGGLVLKVSALEELLLDALLEHGRGTICQRFLRSSRVEGSSQPLHFFTVDRDHVETARRQRGQASQKVARGEHDAALLGGADAGRGTALFNAGARSHLDEDERAVTLAQDQIDLAAARMRAAGDSIIAPHEHEAAGTQKRQRLLLGGIAGGLAGRAHRRLNRAHTALNIDPLLLQRAAADAAAHQHHRPGSLYVVATPIGNLADLTLRAVHVLARVADAVACEDTRVTAALLRHIGVGDKPLIALHAHNEAEAAQAVLTRLASGQSLACVTDAGTPAVSDPGARLVAVVAAAGHPVVPLPGPSSAIAAMSVAGDAHGSGFDFIGFLPAKGAERRGALAQLLAGSRAQIVFEAPHRIEALLAALAQDAPDRRITLCRELTKQFETVHTDRAGALPAWLAEDPNRGRGEFVLVLHAAPAATAAAAGPDAGALRTLALLLRELPLKQAVALAAEISGAPRNALYQAALAQRRGDGNGEPRA
jgi:16S rRNA (cytidine1402-2'-O)-methyltransferase